MNERKSGILLHITSLPSPYGIGDLGPWAFRFADFLAEGRQHFWQVLPLNPTNRACGNSPYSSTSVFAANTYLISPEFLVTDGFLSEKDISAGVSVDGKSCDYDGAVAHKGKLFIRAHKNFKKKNVLKGEYEKFCCDNAEWLDDYALFQTLRKQFDGKPWNSWPEKLKNRDKKALDSVRSESEDEMVKVKFLQFLFYRQWFALKDYCNGKGIRIIGDLPIYVNYDSSDVWTHPDIFKLDNEKNPTHVAGVPPDYFSKTGQLWGNPVYRWDVLKNSGFNWWVQRMKYRFMCFDALRIDHFRGLVSYWEIPAGEETAVNGKWANVPAMEFFDTMRASFNPFPIIAEDLGHITPDVTEVLRHFGFPGMKVLLFAFNENHPMHPYLPHTYTNNWVVYTGTHDNNTVRGWFEKEASDETKERVFRYFGRKLKPNEVSLEFIRLAMLSVANTCIFPLQDVLGLGEEARMNIPSTPAGNWRWRFIADQLTGQVAQKLREMTETYGRA
ncbi:MAG: 4-alpha-glucanotransferase [Candidatus Omnitrophica bacterium]|nr:4-alpha-glucanotransferase [Candidatus Omnitrophota bacterium]